MYGTPWGYPVPPTDRSLKTIQEDIDFLEAWKRKIDDKEKADKAKKKGTEFPRFSFLETVSLAFLFSVPCGIGLGYLYMQLMFKLLTQMSMLEPVLKSLPK